jgi:hypothetical protein
MTDSVSLRQDSFYEEQGITAISNNSAVVSRDQSGNVLIQPTSSLLVIEAITTNILAESVLPLINTQFNYFKFPARTAIVDETLDLDLDLNLDLNLQLEDSAVQIETSLPSTPARYKPNENEEVVRATKVTAQPINLSVVTVGPPQINTNSFTIVQDLIDSGKSLKITGVITTQYNSNRNSVVGFLISYKLPSDETIYEFADAGDDGVFYPGGDDVNNNNKVTKEGIYKTNIDLTIDTATLVTLGIDTQIFLTGFAEDQLPVRNHTILADSTYVKFEAV